MLGNNNSKGKGGKPRRETFSTRWGLILTAMGAAIGTGNIWRFPKETAANGGSAFLIAYIIFLFIWSIPLLMTEFAIGKKTRLGTIGSFKHLIGKKYAWMGAWMIFISVAINFYYAVVMGWTIKYFTVAASGGLSSEVDSFAMWNQFITSPGQVVLFQFIAIGVAFYIVYRGVTRGIEVTNKILMPILFGLLIFITIWAIAQPGSVMGLKYLFVPRMEYLGRPSTWIRALAQSAWSCSAGMGMAITYACYMKKREDTALNSVLTGLGDTTAALIAGIAVLCTVFALSASVPEAYSTIEASGTGITFIHLTHLFSTMPGGTFIAGVFFIAVTFAALTSLIAGFEAATRNFMDHGWTRDKSIKVVALAVFICGLPSAIIFTTIDGNAVPAFLENQDMVWGLGLIVSGLFVAFAVWKYGIEKFRTEVINTEWNDIYIGRWYYYVVKYVFPSAFIILILWYFGELITMQTDEWWVGGTVGLMLLIMQWSIVLALFYKYNDWIADKITAKPFVQPEDTVRDDPRVKFTEVTAEEYLLVEDEPG